MPGPLVDVELNEFDADGRQVRFAISPFGSSETREERIARLESIGSLDPGCDTCVRHFYPASDPASVFHPGHKPSRLCRMGGRRPHCTCKACW